MADGQPSLGVKKSLSSYVKTEARRLGFDICQITHPHSIPQAPERLASFIQNAYHASMEWMAETTARRSDPSVLWPEVKSIVMLGMNYGPDCDPLENLAKSSVGSISVYARNRDYHDVIKGKLKELAGKLATRSGCDVKVFVDTAPVMEKPLAQAAGLGWQGKHTNLVSRDYGSWLFLGSIFTTASLTHDTPETDHCGSCRACLDACPTAAFPAPYQIDANRCISYLTIEHKGMIDREFREKIGNRIYGCDDCLAACPWNKFAANASEMKLKTRDDLLEPRLDFLLSLDDSEFRRFFSGSPVKRIGRNRFIRNCLIAAGNSNDADLIKPSQLLSRDPDPYVRATAIWALSRLMTKAEFADLSDAFSSEIDKTVLAEMASLKDETCI